MKESPTTKSEHDPLVRAASGRPVVDGWGARRVGTSPAVQPTSSAPAAATTTSGQAYRRISHGHLERAGSCGANLADRRREPGSVRRPARDLRSE